MMRKEIDILDTKGREYARDEYGNDVLANFKRKEKTFNVDILKVWGIDFEKHIDAILNYVRTGKVLSESIASRFMDARNYLLLGMALIQEHVKEVALEASVHEPLSKGCLTTGHLVNANLRLGQTPEYEIYKDSIGRTRKRKIIQSTTAKTLTKRKRRKVKINTNEQN